jgi:hypothetical protein
MLNPLRWTTVFFALALLLFSGQASAYTITNLGNAGGNPGDLCGIVGDATTCQPYFEVSGVVAGDHLDLTWDLDGSVVLGPDLIADFPTLAATASLDVASITATTVVIDITLDNTTNPASNLVGLIAGIVSFGLELEGFTSGILSTAGISLDTYDTNNIAGGPGLTVDFCASTDASCNAGNSGDGIQIGASDILQFTLSGAFDVGGITLSNFATKWQTNRDELFPLPDDPDVLLAGNSSFEQPGLPGGIIPEPNTAALMVIGLAGLAWKSRRRS